MKLKQSGFIISPILFSGFLIVVLAGAGVWLYQSQQTKSATALTPLSSPKSLSSAVPTLSQATPPTVKAALPSEIYLQKSIFTMVPSGAAPEIKVTYLSFDGMGTKVSVVSQKNFQCLEKVFPLPGSYVCGSDQYNFAITQQPDNVSMALSLSKTKVVISSEQSEQSLQQKTFVYTKSVPHFTIKYPNDWGIDSYGASRKAGILFKKPNGISVSFDTSPDITFSAAIGQGDLKLIQDAGIKLDTKNRMVNGYSAQQSISSMVNSEGNVTGIYGIDTEVLGKVGKLTASLLIDLGNESMSSSQLQPYIDGFNSMVNSLTFQ